MDEKYIEHIYGTLGGEQRFGKYEAFKNLISTNDQYRKQVYDAFGENTFGKYDAFDGLVKKKDLTSSPSPAVAGAASADGIEKPSLSGVDLSPLNDIKIGSPESNPDQVRENYDIQRKEKSNLKDFLTKQGEYSPERENMTQNQKFAYDNFGVVGGGLFDLGRKVKSFVANDIPAMLENLNPEDFGGPGATRAKQSLEKQGVALEGTTDEAQAERYTKSKEQRREGIEALQGIPQTWAEAKKSGSTGIASYIGSALGMGLSQMPLAVGTMGTSSFYLEKDDAYNESVEAIAKENKTTPEEVIKKGLDKPAREVSNYVGAINAVLERIGAGKALAPLRGMIQRDLLSRGLSVGESALTEYVTERAQDFNTQVGALVSTGKDIKDIDFSKDIDWNRNEESGIQGALAGGGLSTASNIISNGQKGKDQGTETSDKVSGEVGEQIPAQEQGQNQEQNAPVENVRPESLDNNIDNTKLQHEEGNKTERIPPGANQESVGIKQDDAENLTRGIQETGPATPGAQRSAREVKKEQDNQLESYAKEHGAWIDDVKESFGEKLDGGTEQDVYLNKEGDKVIKVNGLANHSSWSEFWNRLNLQKRIFPGESYKLLGFTKVGGRLSAVSEQPYIKGTPVSRQELIKNLNDRGFYQVHPEGSQGENIFYNPELGVRISDVHSENVIKDHKGIIRYIDPMLDNENPFASKEEEKAWIEKQKPQADSKSAVPPTAVEQTANEGGDFTSVDKMKYVVQAYISDTKGTVVRINEFTPEQLRLAYQKAVDFYGDNLPVPDNGRYADYVNPGKSSKSNERQPLPSQTEQPTNTTPATEPNTIAVNTEVPNGEVIDGKVGEGIVERIQKLDRDQQTGNKLPEPIRNEPQVSENDTNQQYNTDSTKGTQTGQSDITIGQTVDFETAAGADRTGVVTSVVGDKVKIKDNNGIIHTVSKTNIQGVANVKNLAKKFDAIMGKAEDKAKKVNSGIVPVTFNPFTFIKQGFGLFNKMQEVSVGKLIKKLENWEARTVNQGLRNQNYLVRAITNLTKNLFGGVAYNEAGIKNKLEYTGNKNYGHLKAKMMADDMYKLIDKKVESLERVHQVLDPEKFENPISYSDLNEAEQKLHDIIRAQNDFIHEWSHDNGFISDETYNEHKGKYIARFYEDIEMAPKEVMDVIRQTRADFSMYKQRKEDVELELLKDPVYATAKRMAQILHNQAIFDYADAISKNKDVKISDTEFPGSVRLGEPGGKPYYGSLTGKYVPAYIAEDFRGHFFMNEMTQMAYGLFRKYDKNMIRQFMKRGLTVYNPIVQLGNMMSNFSFAFWAGIDPVTFAKNQVLMYKDMKNNGPVYQKLVQNGLIGTDIASEGMVPVTEQATVANPQTVGDKFQNAKEFVKKKYNQFSEKASSIYSGSDDLAKMSAFQSFLEMGYSEEEAAMKTYEGFQNYATVGKAWDFASKTPVVGNPFIKFKADLMRILKNGMTRRPLTTVAYLAGLRLIATALSEASDEDDEERMIRERRAFIPKIPTPFGDVPMVWQTPIGEVNVARYMAPFYIYDAGKENGSIANLSDFIPYQFSDKQMSKSKDIMSVFPDFADPLFGPYMQVAWDTDFRGMSIQDPKGSKFGTVAPVEDRIMNSINYIARTQVPLFQRAQDMISAYNGDADYYGRERTVSQAILNNIVKIQEFGDKQAAESLTKEIEYLVKKFEGLNRDIGNIKSQYAKQLEDVNSRVMSDEKRRAEFKEIIDTYNSRMAEMLEQQVDITKQLEEPFKLLGKIKK